MTCLRLAKAGYWGGDPEKVASARVDYVLDALAYNGFLNELEEVARELNKKD